MKEFAEFKKELNSGLLKELQSTAKSKAMKITNLDELSGSEKLGAMISFQRISSEIFTISLLEKYHEWLNS
ncbi:MAG: hypothetical protein IJT79_08480 [Ruminococcus sp.]|nr:hypothetical protein [Ruminococcus sp.]